MSNERILVVDGRVSMQEIYRALFASHAPEYGMCSVGSGEAALRFIRENNVDLVVLGEALPGISALDVLQLLRAQEDTQSLPIIVIASNDQHQGRVLALKAGADHYETAPLNTEEFLPRVRRLLQQNRRYGPARSILRALKQWGMRPILAAGVVALRITLGALIFVCAACRPAPVQAAAVAEQIAKEVKQ